MDNIYRACYIRMLMLDWIGPTCMKRDPRCPRTITERLTSPPMRVYNAIADQRPEWESNPAHGPGGGG